jgi:hypothetical protein
MIAQRLRAMTAADPVRALLAVLGTAIAAGGALLSLNTAYRVNEYLGNRTRDGLVFSIVNAEVSPQGGLRYQDPPVFNAELCRRLRQDDPAIQAMSAVDHRGWERIQVGDVLYRPRAVVGAEPGYAAVVGLRMAAGRFLTRQDMEGGSNTVVICAAAARVLFGGPAGAVGKVLYWHYRQMEEWRTEGATGWRLHKVPMEVVGVFEDPSPLLRDLYGIADFIFPVTMVSDPAVTVSDIMVRVAGDGESQARASLDALTRARLDAAAAVSVWRGRDPRTDADIRQTRRQRAGISFIFGLVAAAALLVGGVGLVAVMTAESLERERETGIRRCLGASRGTLMAAGGLRALGLALCGLALGAGAAAGLSAAALRAVYPILYADAEAFRSLGISQGLALPPLLIAATATVLLALAAGTLPQSALLGARPAENLRG